MLRVMTKIRITKQGTRRDGVSMSVFEVLPDDQGKNERKCKGCQ